VAAKFIFICSKVFAMRFSVTAGTKPDYIKFIVITIMVMSVNLANSTAFLTNIGFSNLSNRDGIIDCNSGKFAGGSFRHLILQCNFARSSIAGTVSLTDKGMFPVDYLTRSTLQNPCIPFVGSSETFKNEWRFSPMEPATYFHKSSFNGGLAGEAGD